MSMWPSPVDSDGNGLWSGGGMFTGQGVRPWWDFPTPLGPPKTQHFPGACWQDMVAKTGEAYWMPVMCNGSIRFPEGTHFPTGTPWWDWFNAAPR